MSNNITRMTRDELREMIDTAFEEKLLEMLGDPDAGLEINKKLRARLVRQKKTVASGENGQPFEAVVQRLGLE